MLGIYFSGTGNSRYCVEKFLQEYEPSAQSLSITDSQCVRQMIEYQELVFAFPVQYSNIPKIVRDFVTAHAALWKGKQVFIIATMGLFSGDGAGVLGRLLEKYGVVVLGGLHLKMPDSIGDEKALKRSLESNRELVRNAGLKIERAVKNLKNGHPPREGIGVARHMAGLFGQRLYFSRKTKQYSDKLKIDAQKCIGCGKCVLLCPMNNIALRNGAALPDSRCTMCYRCISYCPEQAITLLGRRVIEQCHIEKYR